MRHPPPTRPTSLRDAVLQSDEAAFMLGVEPGTLRVWRSQARGPAWFRHTPQGPAMYRREDVLAYLRGVRRAHGGPATPEIGSGP